ncbi:MAG: tRNA (adenosine(37)-N6)-dimethylallyltransferase MiaA [Peptococcaceae bacterium]|nr:tRNA (adenosine(37)-N6)-dimethylallyltransferase MiaA [Peptococcaceae bacterium]
MQPLVIIVGPTAVGKSALGVELALKVNGEIISGDSVQVYKKLNIGSAKPTLSEQKGVKHHLIDFLDPAEPFNAATFQIHAHNLIKSIKDRGKVPIVVGGTGLYVRSITDNFNFPQKGSQDFKAKWLRFAKIYGKKKLHSLLKKYDPKSAQIIHVNDTSRIIRALEVLEITGKPLSEQRNYNEKKYPELDRSIVYVGLEAPRQYIYEKINQRCLEMVNHGIINEVIQLLEQGYSPKIKSLQSIGYRHVLYYIYGLVTLEEMIRLFQRDTRHFAKRQLTWFKRDPRIKWYNINENSLNEIVLDIYNTCREIQTCVE